ncbi:MAG: alanine racemase [Nitrospirota bacterium]
MHRGAIAEIDLDAVSENLKVVKHITGNSPVIAVVKADAYGHGAIEVSGRLAADGVYGLAVAFLDEAIKLREAGLRSRVLVLFDKDNISDYFSYDLLPVVHDIETARRFSIVARSKNRSIDIHVKTDTGMGRLGLNSSVLNDIRVMSEMEGIRIAGLMSHFSDADLADVSNAGAQLERFNAVREEALKITGDSMLCHIANSAATISLRASYLDAVRPGIMLYGVSPFMGQGAGGKGLGEDKRLKPAMRVRTKILALRRLPKGAPVSYGGTFITRGESLIAAIPVGYADGYMRSLSNNSDMLISGKRAPVAGRICMDLTMVDVTDIENVRENDEVVILGRQGREEITAAEIAERAGTISYEVLTTLGNRSRRVFINGNAMEHRA